MLWKSISPDSLAPAIQRMKKQEQQAADPVLKAVWNAVLGKLYEENVYDISLSDEGEQTSHYRVNKAKAQEYFMKALAQPEQLAHHTSTEYAPLTMKGLDGSSFGNDLLHLIGFEADSKEAYLKMYTYYNKVGNRGAACLCAFEVIQKYRQDDVREVKNRSISMPSTRSFMYIKTFPRRENWRWSTIASWRKLPTSNRLTNSIISTMP